MLYLERIPAAPLSRFVQVLWYSQAPVAGHNYERILPTGRTQVILNLECDFLHDCLEGRLEGAPDQRIAPGLVVGGRSSHIKTGRPQTGGSLVGNNAPQQIHRHSQLSLQRRESRD